MKRNRRQTKQAYEKPSENKGFVMPEDKELNEMLGLSEDYVPSEDMKKMMRDIAYQTWLKDNKKGKVAAILISIPIYIISGLVTYAIGSQLFRFIENEQNTDIIIEKDEGISPEEIESVYIPSFLPDGYKLLNQDVFPEEVNTFFSNEDTGTTIIIRQHLSDFSYSYDTEDLDLEEFFTMNGEDAVYFTKHGNGHLFYYFENYLFLMNISDIEQINKETTIKIANSLIKVTED